VVDNQVYATPAIQEFQVQHPQSIAFAEAHAAFLKVLNEPQVKPAVTAVSQSETAANIAAVTKVLGTKNFALLVKYQAQLKTLVVPYETQLNYLSAHQAQLTELQTAVAKSPSQWQKWFWVDFAGMVIFIPTIWLTKGRWSPRRARRDAEEHDRFVAEELAKLGKESAGSPA